MNHFHFQIFYFNRPPPTSGLIVKLGDKSLLDCSYYLECAGTDTHELQHLHHIVGILNDEVGFQFKLATHQLQSERIG